MNDQCRHEALLTASLMSPPKNAEVCQEKRTCPDCHREVEIEFIKTLPMIDDIVLSPRWVVRTVLD